MPSSALDRYGHLFPKLDETLTTRLDDLHRAAVLPTPAATHLGIDGDGARRRA